MAINFKAVETKEEYLNLVEKFSFLVDSELKLTEGYIESHNNDSIISSLPKLISLANTIGYLRGQDNAFIDVRPQGMGIQDDLYQNEDNFEARLNKIIDYIVANDKEGYTNRLNQYFIKARKVD
jgi:hypothetical protein